MFDLSRWYPIACVFDIDFQLNVLLDTGSLLIEKQWLLPKVLLTVRPLQIRLLRLDTFNFFKKGQSDGDVTSQLSELKCIR